MKNLRFNKYLKSHSLAYDNREERKLSPRSVIITTIKPYYNWLAKSIAAATAAPLLIPVKINY